MVVVKMKRDTEGGVGYLWNACRYLQNPDRAMDIGGYGLNPYFPEDTLQQIMQVKRYYGKTSGNPLLHFIVSYDMSVNNFEAASILSDKIASYFINDYQVLWCLHEKERYQNNRLISKFHTHIVVNSVSYRNSRMFDSSYSEMMRFCSYISDITGRQCKFYFAKKDK